MIWLVWVMVPIQILGNIQCDFVKMKFFNDVVW